MKYELIDESEAPENLTNLTAESQAKLALIRSLEPGKVAKVPVANTKEARRAFRVAMTRLGNDQDPKIGLEMWGDETHLYVKRVPHKDEQTPA